MLKSTQILSRWLPALLVMLVIFMFSAQPSADLPDFDRLDRIVKKSGHMIGYALLALAYWRALGWKQDKRWIAWLLAIAYALTDELHQSLVPGRTPAILDVLGFDSLGALLSLWLAGKYRKQKRPDTIHPIVNTADR
jgi:VanZ family protein